MPVTVVQANNTVLNQDALLTSVTVTLPTAPATGRTLIAAVSVDKNSGGAISASTGWNVVASYNFTSISEALAFRVSDGGAADSSVTFTWTTTRAAQAGIIETNQGAATLAQASTFPNPPDDIAATTITGNAGTATAAGFAVAVSSQDSRTSGSTTWSGGYTTLVDYQGVVPASGGGGTPLSIAALELANGAATTTTATMPINDQPALIVARFDASSTARSVMRRVGKFVF